MRINDNGVDREMTSAEQDAHSLFAAAELNALAIVEAEKVTQATAKTAAQAKLAALGLTTDDLKALGLGGN